MKYLIYLILFHVITLDIMIAQVEQQLFKEPFRLKINNDFINVEERGHAAPYLYDINNDGNLDLLIGYYGRKRMETDKIRQGHHLTEGACKIYINEGDNYNPSYRFQGEIMAGNERAIVPCDCCVGFVPAIADIDGDGVDDLVSGSFPGQAYFFKGIDKNKFEPFQFIRDTTGNVLNPGHTTTVIPFDWDNDGDLDLVWGIRGKGVGLSRNVGTKETPKFLPVKIITIPPYAEGSEKVSSHTVPVDWDGDGLFDLVCGSESGDVFVCINTGVKGEPAFTNKPEILILNKRKHAQALVGENLPHGYRSKIFVHDYNCDGKLDIVLGDVYTEKEVLRTLTAEELALKKEKEQAARGDKNERRNFYKPYYDFVEIEYKRIMSDNPDLTKVEAMGLAWNNLPLEMQESLSEYLQKSERDWAFLKDFKTKKTYVGGCVWVYLQK